MSSREQQPTSSQRSSLVAAFAASVILLGLCLVNGTHDFQTIDLMILGGLLVLSDILALPLPRFGFLSYSFIWAFVLCQVAGSTVSAILLILSLVVRFAVIGKGKLAQRALHFFSELLPALLALALLQVLRGSSSFGMTAGHVATAIALVAYYLSGEGCLTYFYGAAGSHGSDIGKRSDQSRRLQLRINTMFSPAAAVLVSGGLSRVLWLLPVLLATHQFFWDRFVELKKMQTDADRKQVDLRKTETALEVQSKRLDHTKNDRDLIQRCLEVFSDSADIRQTGKVILELLSDIIPAQQYALFWESSDGFGPLVAADRSGRSIELSPDQFADLSLLQSCYRSKQVVSGKDGTCWCFPLFERGVLYLGSVSEPPTESQKRSLVLLTRQATFGLRSALLFEQLKQTVEQEKEARTLAESARAEAVRAKDDLEIAQTHLIQSSKLAAVGQMAAGVAHELNSPLAAILLSIQAGRRSLKKSDYEKALERFNRCEEAAERAKHIVNGLLTRSRQSGTEETVVSLGVLVQETCDFLAEQLSREGATIRFSAEEEVQVKLNADEVSQILTNLVLNAHQSMDEQSSECIMVSVGSGDGYGFVEVTDQGRGISPEYRDRVFEPFFTTKTKGQGTGLGLYISSDLAKKNGGELKLKSTGSKGTTFELTLPLSN